MVVKIMLLLLVPAATVVLLKALQSKLESVALVELEALVGLVAS